MSDRSIESLLNEIRSSVSTGDRSLFPPVLSHVSNSDSLRLELDIRPDLDWFKGHFPGNPVLPGVVQLHWAVAIARTFFDLQEVPREVLRLKFKNIVVPPRVIELTLTLAAPGDVKFEYKGDSQPHSQGLLRFPGRTR